MIGFSGLSGLQVPLNREALQQWEEAELANQGLRPAPLPAATETPASTAQDDYFTWLRGQQEAERQERQRQERATASSFLRGILDQYGMGSLASQVESLINQWGTNTNVIAERLRQTQEYQTRFKGLVDLQRRGIADVRNEAEYLDLESRYRGVFREAGLRDFLGQAGTQAEIDSIARIVGDFSLSVDEVRERVTDAQRVVAETPQEVRTALQQFYGIDPSLMVQYVLDSQRTSTEIQRRANAAIVGGFAQRAGLDFGVGISERVGEFLGGERNLRGTEIEPQLTEIADIQRSTQRLAEIEGGTLSAEESALSALNLDQQARERTRTLQSRERARFGGSSAITTGSLAQARQI